MSETKFHTHPYSEWNSKTRQSVTLRDMYSKRVFIRMDGKIPIRGHVDPSSTVGDGLLRKKQF
jgi:hypothetical protein